MLLLFAMRCVLLFFISVKTISNVIVAKTNAIININLKSSKPPLYIVFLLKKIRYYEEDFVIDCKIITAVCER